MLPYTKGVSEDVQRVCRKFVMKVVFRSGDSLCYMLTKVKDSLMMEKPEYPDRNVGKDKPGFHMLESENFHLFSCSKLYEKHRQTNAFGTDEPTSQVEDGAPFLSLHVVSKCYVTPAYITLTDNM